MQAKCQDKELEIPKTQWVIQRSTLGVIVVCFDVAILVSFIISLWVLGHYERVEDNEVNENLLTTEDFAVVVKNMPEF